MSRGEIIGRRKTADPRFQGSADQGRLATWLNPHREKAIRLALSSFPTLSNGPSQGHPRPVSAACGGRSMPSEAKPRRLPSTQPRQQHHSPKRAKMMEQPSPLKTPFMSALTGLPYMFDATFEESHVLLRATPLDPSVPCPDHVGPFLASAAGAFSTEVHDVLLGPHFLLVSLTLDQDRFPDYFDFVSAQKIPVPDSSSVLHIEEAEFETVLQTYLDPIELSSYLLATGIRSAPSEENCSSDSLSDSESPSTISAAPAQPLPEAATTPMIVDLPVTDSQRPSRADAPRRRKTQYHAIDFSTLVVEVPPPAEALTVLLRPTDLNDSFKKANPALLHKELAALGYSTILAIRDIRDGGMALDLPLTADAANLLATTRLLDRPVKVSLPVVTTRCHGVITGVHPDITPDELLTELTTSSEATVTAAHRMAKPGAISWTVKLTFSTATPPERVFLYCRTHRVSAYKQRPLQCFNCNIYGHAAKHCRSKRSCVTCNQDHPSADCPNFAMPVCRHCEGHHPANSPDCPAHHFQRKVLQVKTTNNTSFKIARTAVQKAVRSYATVTKATPKPPARNLRHPPDPVQLNSGFIQNIAHHGPPPPATTISNLLTAILALISAIPNSATLINNITELFSSFTANAVPVPLGAVAV